MSDYLVPEEILIDILVKLPVKSLIRGTSVCKQWRTLIRSPSFISAHLSNSENQALIRRYDFRREHYTVIPKRGNLVFNSDSELEFPFKWPYDYLSIVGSCDGLVCLSERNSQQQRIIIWNPAIRNHVILPKIQLVDNRYLVMLGFGVANNVYKVVRLVNSQNPFAVPFVPPQAEVFCLGGGTGRWRRLSGFDVSLFALGNSSVFFKGLVHWTTCEPMRNCISILRFHIGDEVFGQTMLPQELERARGRGALMRSLSLAVMGESLGAIKHDGELSTPFRCCDVWMMKDYGVKESWTKLYRIDTVRYERVVGFWGSGELALLTLHNNELVTYNSETKGIKHVGVFGYTPSFYVLNDYKESLVLLGGGYSGDSGEEFIPLQTCCGWTGNTCNIL